ncbi:MAG: AMP-binding protein, partial [Cloacibacillus sp.]
PVMCLAQHRYTEISQIAAKAKAVGYIIPGYANKYNYAELADQVASELPYMKFKMIAGLGQEIPDGYVYINDLLSVAAEGEGDPELLAKHLPDPHDVCILLLSGGTTGIPKLIPREYNAYRYVAEESSRELGYNMYTVQLAVAPVAHNMVLAAPGIQGAFSFGGKVVMSTSAKTEDICKLIEKEKITHIPMVPAMIINMLNFEDRGKYDLSSWEIVINGGSKIEPVVAARVCPELGCRLVSQFGMSEGTITQTSLFDEEDVIYNTIGFPVSPADEWKIIDKDDGSLIAASVHDGSALFIGDTEKPGEIIFRGPYTIRGYYDAYEHNQKAFTEDGFYRSGDLAAVHKSGRGFVIMGRIKDAINRGGEKFSCEEVENLVLKYEKVHDAALVPMPDHVLGEKACLFVSLRNPEDTLTLKEILEFLAGKLAKFKLPERLEIRHDLPHTNIGKVRKEELRQEIYAIMAEEEKNKA